MGKSTLVKLLTRLYQPLWGHIYLHGNPINELKPHEVTGAVTVIEQNFVLFDGTVKDNIMYGAKKDTAGLSPAEAQAAVEAAEAEMQAVIDACCLRDDVDMHFSKGLETPVGTNGKALSKGQQQRIAPHAPEAW